MWIFTLLSFCTNNHQWHTRAWEHGWIFISHVDKCPAYPQEAYRPRCAEFSCLPEVERYPCPVGVTPRCCPRIPLPRKRPGIRDWDTLLPTLEQMNRNAPLITLPSRCTTYVGGNKMDRLIYAYILYAVLLYNGMCTTGMHRNGSFF